MILIFCRSDFESYWKASGMMEAGTNRRRHEYQPRFKFDSAEDCGIALSQGIAQEHYFIHHSVTRLRSRPVQCIFFKVDPEEIDEVALEFTVLVFFNKADKAEFKTVMPQLLSGNTVLSLAFQLPPPITVGSDPTKDKDKLFWPGVQIPHDQWAGLGCDFAMTIRRPGSKDVCKSASRWSIQSCDPSKPVKSNNNYYLKFHDSVEVSLARFDAICKALVAPEPEMPVNVSPCVLQRLRQFHRYKQDLLTGGGFRSLLSPPPLSDKDKANMEAVLTSDQSQASERQTARYALGRMGSAPSIVIMRPDGWVAACESNLGAFKKMFGSDLGRVEKFLPFTRLNLIPIHGFAGSGKTQMVANFAVLFMARQDIQRLYCSAPTNVATSNLAERIYSISGTGRRHRLLVIRGYKIGQEVSAFISMVRGESKADDKYKTSSWKAPLSAAEWYYKVAMRKRYDIAPNDPPQLQRLRTRLGEMQGETWAKFREWLDNDGQNVSFPMDGDLYNCVSSSIGSLVVHADAVCTTPLVSATKPWVDFNLQLANAVVLDEAGAMLQADALLVWGAGCRPCVMGGDPLQRPTVLSFGVRTADDHATNPFAFQMRTSILEFIQRSGYPCFVLNTEYPIAKGNA